CVHPSYVFFINPSYVLLCPLSSVVYHLNSNSFPTRRSSDLYLRAAVSSFLLPPLSLSSSRSPLTQALNSSMVFSPHLPGISASRSEEHTSELQSREKLVCCVLLEKKKDIMCLVQKIFSG